MLTANTITNPRRRKHYPDDQGFVFTATVWPKAVHTAAPGAESFELTQAHVLEILPTLVGKRVAADHGTPRIIDAGGATQRVEWEIEPRHIGRIIDAWISKSGKLRIRVRLDTTLPGMFEANRVVRGIKRDVSLSLASYSDADTGRISFEVDHVAVVTSGGKTGTHIHQGRSFVDPQSSFEGRTAGVDLEQHAFYRMMKGLRESVAPRAAPHATPGAIARGNAMGHAETPHVAPAKKIATAAASPTPAGVALYSSHSSHILPPAHTSMSSDTPNAPQGMTVDPPAQQQPGAAPPAASSGDSIAAAIAAINSGAALSPEQKAQAEAFKIMTTPGLSESEKNNLMFKYSTDIAARNAELEQRLAAQESLVNDRTLMDLDATMATFKQAAAGDDGDAMTRSGLDHETIDGVHQDLRSEPDPKKRARYTKMLNAVVSYSYEYTLEAKKQADARVDPVQYQAALDELANNKVMQAREEMLRKIASQITTPSVRLPSHREAAKLPVQNKLPSYAPAPAIAPVPSTPAPQGVASYSHGYAPVAHPPSSRFDKESLAAAVPAPRGRAAWMNSRTDLADLGVSPRYSD